MNPPAAVAGAPIAQPVKIGLQQAPPLHAPISDRMFARAVGPIVQQLPKLGMDQQFVGSFEDQAVPHESQRKKGRNPQLPKPITAPSSKQSIVGDLGGLARGDLRNENIDFCHFVRGLGNPIAPHGVLNADCPQCQPPVSDGDAQVDDQPLAGIELRRQSPPDLNAAEHEATVNQAEHQRTGQHAA